MDRELLEAYGVNYDEGEKRCLGDSAFYEKLLSMFLKDESFARAKAAFELEDDRALFSGIHELKGVSATAALTELYAATCPLVECLRRGDGDREELNRLFAAVDRAYTRVSEGIRLAGAK